MIKSFKDLIVWQKSMDAVVEVYALTSKLPKEEIYGLASQLKRAVTSIPSNIAEGYSRNTKKDYINFLHIARGSNSEVQTQLLICERLGYLTEQDTEKAMLLLDEVGKILNAIINKLQ